MTISGGRGGSPAGAAPAWVALACACRRCEPGAAVVFRARADEPIRVSVQVRGTRAVAGRAAVGADGVRGHRGPLLPPPVERAGTNREGGSGPCAGWRSGRCCWCRRTHGLPGMRRARGRSRGRESRRARATEAQVRTVSRRYAAPAVNRMFGAQAARPRVSSPAVPIAANRLNSSQ